VLGGWQCNGDQPAHPHHPRRQGLFTILALQMAILEQCNGETTSTSSSSCASAHSILVMVRGVWAMDNGARLPAHPEAARRDGIIPLIT